MVWGTQGGYAVFQRETAERKQGMSTQGRAQFTPGPWRVINDKTIVGADYPRQGYVADVNLHRNSDAQEVDGQANATLIAAAPAMYTLLQDATLQLARLTGSNLETYARTFSVLAKKALAQAEGRER